MSGKKKTFLGHFPRPLMLGRLGQRGLLLLVPILSLHSIYRDFLAKSLFIH